MKFGVKMSAGRPRKDDNTKRTVPARFYLTESEYEHISKLAHEEKIGFSEFVRQRVFELHSNKNPPD
jgi:hypothetical protein